MNKKTSRQKKLCLASTIILLLPLLFMAPKAMAQFGPYYYGPYYYGSYYNPFFGNPFFGFGFGGFGPFGYFPGLPSTPPLLGYRYANVPLTSSLSSLFPAPTLPLVPASTFGGVGITSLIPTVPVTVALPAASLITTPLAGLITYTPLSLIGLTYAPVPVTAATFPVPITVPTILPTIAPTVTTTPTIGASTAAALISLLSGLII